MKKFSGILLSIIALALISVVDSWASCRGGYTFCQGAGTVPPSRGTCTDGYQYSASCSNAVQQSRIACKGDIIPSGNVYYVSTGVNYCWPVILGNRSCANYINNDGCYTGSEQELILNCNFDTQCDTQREADSLACVIDGNIWQDGTCKVNHCKAADSTWLSTSIAACTGSNNYAIVNTDSTCEHVGTCCPNDSIPSGNACKWRCDSVLTACEGRVGTLFGAVLPDTSVSGEDTTFSYQCFYNCAHAPNTDSTVYLVEGNVVLSGPSDSISDGIKSETFNSFRTTSGGLYIYDYLSPAASEYVDSIAAMKCVEHLWRCVINSKYVYWYDNQEVPVGCTNIVRVK